MSHMYHAKIRKYVTRHYVVIYLAHQYHGFELNQVSNSKSFYF